jgi:DNA-binding winged helix-turn-helix (wHTH) protein
MRTHSKSSHASDRMDSAFVAADSRIPEPRSASIHLLTRPGRHRSAARSRPVPPALQNEMAEFQADIDGLPIQVRFRIKDIPAGMQSDGAAKGTDIHSLLSSTLEKLLDRMHGSTPRSGGRPKQPIVELASREPPVRLPAPPNDTVLRVGPLELDLLDRTAKRGDRQIDLRPREFRLLKYMMQRSDTLLTRATLLTDVWHYKFVPATNLVDVHMGRLRRKVDGPNDAPMIRNIRGVGFVLSETPLSQAAPSRLGKRSGSIAVADLHPDQQENVQ